MKHAAKDNKDIPICHQSSKRWVILVLVLSCSILGYVLNDNHSRLRWILPLTFHTKSTIVWFLRYLKMAKMIAMHLIFSKGEKNGMSDRRLVKPLPACLALTLWRDVIDWLVFRSSISIGWMPWAYINYINSKHNMQNWPKLQVTAGYM